MKMVGVLAVAALAGSAMGADLVKFYDTEGNGNNYDGFTADLKANGYSNPAGDYKTFCVEILEHFNYGVEYGYQISTEVKDNGGNGNRTLTSLAGSRVAYLYSTFMTGGEAAIRALDAAFTGWTDSKTRELIQRYIWDRFAYPDSDQWSNGTFSEAMFDALSLAADTGGAAAGNLFGVRVMNIYDKNHVGDDAYGGQDQLTMIPLPSSAAMAFVGLGGLGAIRRRRA